MKKILLALILALPSVAFAEPDHILGDSHHHITEFAESRRLVGAVLEDNRCRARNEKTGEIGFVRNVRRKCQFIMDAVMCDEDVMSLDEDGDYMDEDGENLLQLSNDRSYVYTENRGDLFVVCEGRVESAQFLNRLE